MSRELAVRAVAELSQTGQLRFTTWRRLMRLMGELTDQEVEAVLAALDAAPARPPTILQPHVTQPA